MVYNSWPHCTVICIQGMSTIQYPYNPIESTIQLLLLLQPVKIAKSGSVLDYYINYFPPTPTVQVELC